MCNQESDVLKLGNQNLDLFLNIKICNIGAP